MIEYQREPVTAVTVGETKIKERREIKVRRSVDVLVCGGGPAGVGAALAAAREGARVLLLERFGMLGGMWTAGLVNPLFEWKGQGYIVEELQAQLQRAGAWRTWKFAHTFEPEQMRHTLEQLMQKNGVAIQYYTLVTDAIITDGQIRGVITESKAGREAILANAIIDATGDGDVAARCGCRYQMGRDADGKVQPVTLMFEVTGLEDYTQENGPALYDALSGVMNRQEREQLLPFGRVGCAPWIITAPSGLSAVQATHIYQVNPLDPDDLTRGVIQGREMMHRLVAALRKLPGFSEIRITQSASALGVREGRRILGRNRVELKHAVCGQTFEDAVTVSRFGTDVHDPAPGSGIETGATGIKHFEIPYGSLVPQDAEGLLLAGRCISGDHIAHSSYRVTGTAMGIGQAAGLAAAIATASNRLPSQIDGTLLRKELSARGVQFLQQ